MKVGEDLVLHNMVFSHPLDINVAFSPTEAFNNILNYSLNYVTLLVHFSELLSTASPNEDSMIYQCKKNIRKRGVNRHLR